MDIKLKYRSWVGQKHADNATHLIDSDIETFGIEFAQWLIDNEINEEKKELLTNFAEWFHLNGKAYKNTTYRDDVNEYLDKLYGNRK